jgi:hypothetical protein
MATIQIFAAVISPICLIITTVLAWVVLYRTNKVQVSFTGTPVDKADFDRALQENKTVHEQLFAKVGGVERGVESRLTAKLDKAETEAVASRRAMHQEMTGISNDVAALKKEAELANQRSVQMDTKIDRLIERMTK